MPAERLAGWLARRRAVSDHHAEQTRLPDWWCLFALHEREQMFLWHFAALSGWSGLSTLVTEVLCVYVGWSLGSVRHRKYS